MSDLATLSIRVEALEVDAAAAKLKNLSSVGEYAEGIVKKLAAAWAAMKLGEHIAEITKMAARYDTLGAAMNAVGGNAGYTSSEMAKFQAGLESTGIAVLEARSALTMMASANLDLAKSSQLARIAQDAAVVGGLNSSEAFERMIQGNRPGDQGGPYDEKSTERKHQAGDPRFLTIVGSCIESRRKILGLDAPAQVQMSGLDDVAAILMARAQRQVSDPPALRAETVQ
jgi:hypothetical protein